MIAAVFVRRLKPGRTFDDFLEAWAAQQGFGVPARVLNAVDVTDPRRILSIGFVDVDPAGLTADAAAVAVQEQARHDRIDDVIESTELRSWFEVRTEHDLTAAPVAIDLGSARSLLAGLG